MQHFPCIYEGNFSCYGHQNNKSNKNTSNFTGKYTLMIYFKLHWKLMMIKLDKIQHVFHIHFFVFWVVDEFHWKELRGIVLFTGKEEQMCVMSVWGEMEICAAIYYIRLFFLSFSISFCRVLTTMSPAALLTDCIFFSNKMDLI